MDSIINAALEEICARGASGIPIPDLWPSLRGTLSSSGLKSCDAVRCAIWARLLAVPALRFDANGCVLSPQDLKVQSWGESQRLGLRIVADEQLRDSFVGLDDLNAANAKISEEQRRTLERVAAARANGITQCELSKEFGMKGNNFFYRVRNLESQQLIIRQSTIVREKDVGKVENGLKNNCISHTNLIHLYRYAKSAKLTSQQKIEITKSAWPDMIESSNEDISSLAGDVPPGECVKDDVLIKDYLPAMKAVCDKLDEANEKILVVSDIKIALGYRMTKGHRAWRNIVRRLEDAGLVEKFQAEVNSKDVQCLRLLKKFDPKDFQSKPSVSRYDGFDFDNLTKHGKRGQTTDQLLELPIEYCIHDIVDAEGHKGITITEICKRLGLNAKRMYTRIAGMCSRFGMCMESEKPNRTLVYRVWTHKNYQLYSTNVSYGNHDEVPGGNRLSAKSNDIILSEQLTPETQQLDSSFQDVDLYSQKIHSAEDVKLSCTSDGVAADAQLSTFGREAHNLMHECSNTRNDPQPDTNERVTECDIAVSERLSLLSPTTSKHTQRYRSVSSTVLGARREQWILSRLKDDKFILCGELYRWIKNMEMDKPTMLDRKTLDRTLNKLQQDGLCKITQVCIPAMTNFDRKKILGVVMHPSIDNISSDLLNQINKSSRDFEFQIHSRESTKPTNKHVTVLTGIERSLNPVDDKPELLEIMRANGYVQAKMVRARLLHNFLWGYIGGLFDSQNCLESPKHDYDLKHHYRTCCFAMGTAIEAMPLELFLQVVGSAKEIDDVLQKCRLGLRLMDLTKEEYKYLLDTQATARISRIIDVLIRLKLIKLVWEGPAGEDLLGRSTPTHALELEPYIEEPMPRVLPHLKLNTPDLRPRTRHDFVLSDLDVVNAYWEALEYSYAAADSVSASLSFPGSVVHEVFSARSWTSVRVMTAEQRKELLQRMEIDNLEKKIPFKECVQIARELNLSVEQVLRVSHDKQLRRVQGDSSTSKSKKRKNRVNGIKSEIVYWKRRLSKDIFGEHVEDDAQIREARPALSITSGAVGNKTDAGPSVINENEIHDNPVEAYTANSNDTSLPEPEPHGEGSKTYSMTRCHTHSRSKHMRRRKFLWTDKADRQLLVQYARYRVTMGDRSHRVIWTSLSDLPTLPIACSRRMAMLNSDKSTRRAVMRLCNLLGERYRRYLNNAWRTLGTEELSHGHYTKSREVLIMDSFDQNILAAHENSSSETIQQNCWDNFEDSDLIMAIDEVLKCKKMARIECTKGVGLKHGKDRPNTPAGGTNLVADKHVKPMEHTPLSSTVGLKDASLGEKKNKGANILLPIGQNKPSSSHSQKKFNKLLNNRGIEVRKQVCESTTVANAVELLKLVFLSTSTAPDAQASVAATLQQYSKCDILAAFNYLRGKEFVVIGNGGGSLSLSKSFWHNASDSPFPVDSGKRANNFSSWLHKHDEILEDGLDLSIDMQCGEFFHLFALVSSGQISVLPCLPKEGTGEADESRRSEPLMLMNDEMNNLKRKSDRAVTPCSNEKAKKQKSQGKIDTDFCCRKEKGFPGIKVLLKRSSNPGVDVLQRSVDGENQKQLSATNEMYTPKDLNKETISFLSAASNLNLSSIFDCEIQLEASLDEPQWHRMTKYATILSASVRSNEAITFCSEVFKSVHSAIAQTGEQGLSIQEISRLMGTQEVELAEVLVNTLEVFQLVIKVNAYDYVRVVSSSYRSKYFICTHVNHGQDNFVESYLRSQGMNCKKILHAAQEHDNHYESQNFSSMKIRDGHRVSLLKYPKPSTPQFGNDPNKDGATSEVCKHVDLVSVRGNETENISATTSGVLDVYHYILPWINSDGSTNTLIYKGLTRRVLGTIMQSPGILEEDIIHKMNVLNPQTCRQLLETMLRDKHITVRSVCVAADVGPPSILQSLFPSGVVSKPKAVSQKHYFGNPMSTSEL